MGKEGESVDPLSELHRESSRFQEFEDHPELVEPSNLNNFWMEMPGGGYQEFERDPRTLREISEAAPGGPTSGVSEMRLGQTQKEFSDVIARTAEEVGIDLGGVRKMIEEMIKIEKSVSVGKDGWDKFLEVHEEADGLHREINEKIIGLYQALRAKGYTHRDLTA